MGEQRARHDTAGCQTTSGCRPGTGTRGAGEGESVGIVEARGGSGAAGRLQRRGEIVGDDQDAVVEGRGPAAGPGRANHGGEEAREVAAGGAAWISAVNDTLH